MFSGTTYPKLDDKGRLVIPSKFRELSDGALYITKNQDNCLAVYTASEFTRIAEQLQQARVTTKSARDYVRNFMASAESEAPDKQGRITIPAHLREYAGLGRELILAGVNNRIEIWDLATWNEFMAQQDAEFADLDEDDVGAVVLARREHELDLPRLAIDLLLEEVAHVVVDRTAVAAAVDVGHVLDGVRGPDRPGPST
mgnify:CR=1 FL=1